MGYSPKIKTTTKIQLCQSSPMNHGNYIYGLRVDAKLEKGKNKKPYSSSMTLLGNAMAAWHVALLALVIWPTGEAFAYSLYTYIGVS